MPLTHEKSAADARISQNDQWDVAKLYEAFRKKKARLISPEGELRMPPPSLHDFLLELVARLNDGRSISIMQSETRLTTAESAAILGTSRQFFVNLLEKGEIPYQRVGSHRRVYARDLFQYKAKRDSSRRSALRDLVRVEVEEGLYGREPIHAGQ